MSYQVIARRFRPARFEEVVGQEVATRTLRNALGLQRMAHAYLFSGTRGVGKTSTARILAKCLNCEQGLSADPCGACSSCEEIGKGASMDVLEIDGASNRGINEVRELRESARYAPARDRYKVFIIDEVHMLTTEAFNALLKIIEEPPSHVVFIFATTEPERVPTTVRSRCQQFTFRRLGESELAASIVKTCGELSVELEDEAVRQLARAADGSLRDAQSLLEQVLAFAGTRVAAADVATVLGTIPADLRNVALKAIAKEESGAALAVVDDLYRAGHDPRLFVGALLDDYRDLLLLKAGRQGGQDVDESNDRKKALKQIAADWSMGDILRSAELLAALDSRLKTASHARLALEMGLVELCELRRLVSLAEGGGDEAESRAEREAPAERRAKPAAREGKGWERFRRGGPGEGSPTHEEAVREVPGRDGSGLGDAGRDQAAAFLERARMALGALGTAVDAVSKVDLSGEEVVLTMSGDGAEARLSSEEVMATLRRVALDFLGKGAGVRIESAEARKKEPTTRGDRAETDAAMSSDVVQKLLDVFKGEVTSVDRSSPGSEG